MIFTIFSGTTLLLPTKQCRNTSCKCYNTTALCQDSVGSALALKIWRIGLHKDPWVLHNHTTHLAQSGPAINLQLHPGLSILYQRKAGIGFYGPECRLVVIEKIWLEG